jgi:hypothetical protein
MKLVGCYLYFRDGEGFKVDSGKLLPLEHDEGEGEIHRVYLINTAGDVTGIRRAVETLVLSLQDWLDRPENGGPDVEIYAAGEPTDAREHREMDYLFAPLERNS